MFSCRALCIARIPYGSVDRQVGVIRVTDENQKVRAVIVNYACHPVVLGPRNRQISADYPGVMRRIVESELGEQCMCIFIQGGGGDINPLIMARGESREKDFDDVQKLGELLAGEPFHQFQVDFRNRSGLKHAYLFGYCCNAAYPWPSYLPDLQSAARGGTELATPHKRKLAQESGW